MAKWLPSEKVLAVQKRALERGGSFRPSLDHRPSRTVEWDVAGDCMSPVPVHLDGRPLADGERVITRVDPSRFALLFVPCRKCENCLNRRAHHWRLRAMSEFRAAPRTWLCTLTLNPNAHFWLLTRTRVRLAKARVSYEGLDPHERFLELDKTGYAEVQKWLKRLRKNLTSFRFLSVTEPHKSGVPHWHVLLHEVREPLRYKGLKGSWHLGFDSYALVHDTKGASYAAKYLSKSLSARVRASKAYGETQVSQLPP